LGILLVRVNDSATTVCEKHLSLTFRLTMPARDVLAADVCGTGSFQWYLPCHNTDTGFQGLATLMATKETYR
jgi:hypothetical protein